MTPGDLKVTSLATGVAEPNFKNVLILNSVDVTPGALPRGFTALFTSEIPSLTDEDLVDVETFCEVIK